MAQQVKFYSVASMPETSSIDQNGLYFKDGGELYKGSSRFGAGRVTIVANTEERDAITGMIPGDIAICNDGTKNTGTYAYDGENWKKTGADVALNGTMYDWKMEGSIRTSTLASIVTGIKQDNGKITAYAFPFPKITSTQDGKITFNGYTTEIQGWSSMTSGLEARVSAIEGMVVASTSTVNANAINASTGSFGELTVSGSTVNQIASAEATTLINALSATQSGSNTWVDISVVETSGKLTGITVSGGPSLVTSVLYSDSSAVPTEGAVKTYVDGKITSLGNVMEFLGVGTVTKTDSGVQVTLPTGVDPLNVKKGGLVIDKTSGREAVCTGRDESSNLTWELIGDNAVYALNAYSKSGSAVMTNVTTVHGGLDALANAVDTIQGDEDTDGSIAQAVKVAKGYIDGKITDLDSEATSTSGSGVEVTVVEEDGKLTSASVAVTKATLNGTLGTTNVADKTIATEIGTTGVDTALATEKAVRDAIKASEMVWLDASGEPIED